MVCVPLRHRAHHAHHVVDAVAGRLHHLPGREQQAAAVVGARGHFHGEVAHGHLPHHLGGIRRLAAQHLLQVARDQERHRRGRQHRTDRQRQHPAARLLVGLLGRLAAGVHQFGLEGGEVLQRLFIGRIGGHEFVAQIVVGLGLVAAHQREHRVVALRQHAALVDDVLEQLAAFFAGDHLVQGGQQFVVAAAAGLDAFPQLVGLGIAAGQQHRAHLAAVVDGGRQQLVGQHDLGHAVLDDQPGGAVDVTQAHDAERGQHQQQDDDKAEAERQPRRDLHLVEHGTSWDR
jgi:hypothetical protein